MKLLLCVLALLAGITTAKADDESVIPIEVRQPRYTIKGGEPKLTTISMGSGVVVDSGKNSKGEPGYMLLTAAHVVVETINDKEGKYVPVPYPYGTKFEVYVQKEWYPANFIAYSSSGDIAYLTFLCDKHIPLVCMADRRALRKESLKANGFVNGNDQHIMEGKCRGEADFPADSAAPNCDIFFGHRESFVGGLSGGAVFDSEGNLAGIISARSGIKPGFGLYTHVGELRRFMKAGWDGNFDTAPRNQDVDLHDRSLPRSLKDEAEAEPTLAE